MPKPDQEPAGFLGQASLRPWASFHGDESLGLTPLEADAKRQSQIDLFKQQYPELDTPAAKQELSQIRRSVVGGSVIPPIKPTVRAGARNQLKK